MEIQWGVSGGGGSAAGALLRRGGSGQRVGYDIVLTWDMEEVGGVLGDVGKLPLLPARSRRGYPVQGGDKRFVVCPELKLPAL